MSSAAQCPPPFFNQFGIGCRRDAGMQFGYKDVSGAQELHVPKDKKYFYKMILPMALSILQPLKPPRSSH